MTDVVVLGSGCAGLTAALAAAVGGASVLVVERAERIGGTTAVSGGGLWLPGARALLEAGVDTPRADLRSYLLTLGGERADPEAVDAFLDRAPEVADALEDNTPLRLQAARYPDYHPELTGGSAVGHGVEPDVVEARALLGDRADQVRTSPFFPGPVTLAEVAGAGGMGGFRQRVDVEAIRARSRRGAAAMGRGLAAGLLSGCLDAGVTVRTGARAVAPFDGRDGAVGGVVLAGGERIEADAVVVASGGFEWDLALSGALVAGPPLHPASPPFNHGDGLRLGMRAGAGVALLQEAWWYPVVELPGETWEDGSPLRRLTSGERTNPHTLMVNRRGRRFCNESASYHVVGRTMLTPDPSGIGWANVPAWLILDAQHRRSSRIQSAGPGAPDPSWLRPAASLDELAHREGIDPAGLRDGVARFNDMARAGRDTDFDRGSSAHDRTLGDPDAPHPCLGTVAEPPFYALPVRHGTIGTKGGLLVDTDHAVVGSDGRRISGLFAAGNAAAGVTAAGYPGAGGTLGPAAVGGWTAGAAAARPRLR